MNAKQRLDTVFKLIMVKEGYKALKELSVELGYHSNYLSTVIYKKGETVPSKIVSKLEYKFKVNPSYITGKSEQPFTNDKTFKTSNSSLELKEPEVSYLSKQDRCRLEKENEMLKKTIEDKDVIIKLLQEKIRSESNHK
jgi:flagellar basal body P-ring protein FlgI